MYKSIQGWVNLYRESDLTMQAKCGIILSEVKSNLVVIVIVSWASFAKRELGVEESWHGRR